MAAETDYNFLEQVHGLIAAFDLNDKQRATLWAAIDPDQAPGIQDGKVLADIARHPANKKAVERYREAAGIPLRVLGFAQPGGDVLDHSKTLDDLLGQRELASWQQITTALGRLVRASQRAN